MPADDTTTTRTLATDFSRGLSDELAARIIREHGSMVVAACRRYLHDESLAQDAAQEVFVELARRASALPSGTLLGGWLYRTACHIASKHLRTHIRRFKRETHPDTMASLTPQPQLDLWQDIEPHLDAAVETLPQTQRDLVVSCYFQGQSQRAVAKTLGWSESKTSRELKAAIESLRRFFAKRGLTISGSALIALLSANAAQGAGIAASAIVVSAMLTTTATSTSSALISTLLAMKLKIALVAAAVLLVSAVGYDLGSNDPLLKRWFGSHAKAVATNSDAIAKSSTSPSDQKQRETAASGIWSRTKTLDVKTLAGFLERWMIEPDEDKQLAILRSMGITITRASYKRFLEERRKMQLQLLDHSSGSVKLDLFELLLVTWAQEAPMEAIAWLPDFDVGELTDKLLWSAMAAIRRDPAAWDAFLKSAPDPKLADHFKLWSAEEDDPGAGWTHAERLEVGEQELRSRLADRIQSEPPERALRSVIACVDKGIRNPAIYGLAPKLSPEQLTELLKLTSQDGDRSRGVTAYLRVMLGEPGASISEALNAATRLITQTPDRVASEQGYGDYEWSQTATRTLIARWLAVDPAAAMKSALTENFGHHLGAFMDEAMRSSSINDEWIASTMAQDPKARDRALTAWYEAQSGGDAAGTLQRIVDSEFIGDEVASAERLVGDWTRKSPQEATAWLRSLSAGDARTQLAGEVANNLVRTDPEAGLALAREEGVPLHGSHVGFRIVSNYLSKATPEAATAVLQEFRGDKDYDQIVVGAARNKITYNNGIHTDAGLQFIADHAEGDWHQTLIGQFDRFISFNEDPEPFARILLSLEPAKHDAKAVADAASTVLQNYIRTGQVNQGMTWTLQLPPAAAQLARTEAAARLNLFNQDRRTTLMKWFQTAPLPEAERASLLAAPNARLKK